ncbi:MAG: hypothetical protein ACLR8Y_15890 [Alistipes indistinctus]
MTVAPSGETKTHHTGIPATPRNCRSHLPERYWRTGLVYAHSQQRRHPPRRQVRPTCGNTARSALRINSISIPIPPSQQRPAGNGVVQPLPNNRKATPSAHHRPRTSITSGEWKR